MISDSLDTLLVKLVRRRLTPTLRTKFDSMDVVQSVWTDLLEAYRAKGWQFNDRDHLQAFLAKVTYNHFLIQCRRNRAALRVERPLPDHEPPALSASGQPRPSQIVQAVELWETILGDCSPTHAEIVRLKRQGLSLAEIASRTGLHQSSVRRILYELARRMAGERRVVSG
jgi:RNA polymerase sigma factor (sigma-70 family)